MEEIFKRVLDSLTGANFWIALGCLAAGIVCWLLIGKTEKQEKKLLRRQITSALILALLAGGAIWINNHFFLREPNFSKNVTGILVMRFVGDDALNSLQGDLIGKLNAELQREAGGQQIEVHAGDEALDENKGLAVAHERARAIGKRLNANLVIWGRKIGEKKVYPRLTMVAAPKDWSAANERTHDALIITELQLPPEVVNEPFYLIHFAAGYSYYSRDRYREALPHFQAALRRTGSSRGELADLQFCTAFCYFSLAVGQKKMATDLQAAIELYESTARVYEAIDRGKWAKAQNNLGVAYSDLPTGDRAENLKRAIAAYEAVLRVIIEKDFPLVWAATQNNLGAAYADLPTGDRAENLQKAIGAYEAALRVFNERDFPVHWAGIQNNVGIAYQHLSAGDRTENLQRAIGAYEAALRVFNERDFPVHWAGIQNNLGSFYCSLPTGDRTANLKKAISACEAALRVRTEKEFPVDWAKTLNNLGGAYYGLPTGDRSANLERAMAAFEAALRVYNETDFPVDWAMTQRNLGLAYMGTTNSSRTENLRNAKHCFEAALRVYTEGVFPEEHREAAANLADVEHQLRISG